MQKNCLKVTRIENLVIIVWWEIYQKFVWLEWGWTYIFKLLGYCSTSWAIELDFNPFKVKEEFWVYI